MIKRNFLAGAVIAAAMTAVAATASFAQGLSGDRLLDVIVVMDEATAPGGHGANQAAAAAFARGLGVNPRHSYGTVLFGFAASVPQAVMDALENNPRIDYVELDGTASASAPKWCADNPTHPACAGDGTEDPPPPTGEVIPWGIARTGAVANVTRNAGAGVHVYVLDTGIDIDHPDLSVESDRVDCTGNGGCAADPGEADDKNGHGTHVAGTIAALKNGSGVVGMAPDAILHAVQVLGNSGRGSYSGIIAGIEWVVTHKLGNNAVINMSLGGSGGIKAGNSCSDSGFFGSGDSFHEAICNASHAGVVVVVAAGNSGDNAANHVPAAYDDTVITVSATEEGDDWPFWSNWGNAVAIAAPGVNILSTWKGGGTNTISGTSMASPHVAGAVALWLASNADEVIPLPTIGFSAYSNARAALLGAAEETDPISYPLTSFINTSGNPHAEDFLDVSTFTVAIP